MTSVVCKANSVIIKNNTHCDMMVDLNGGGGSLLVLSGTTSTPISSGSGLNITAAKVWVPGVIGQVNIDFYHPYAESNFPTPCMDVFFYCKWNQSSLSSNVLLDIGEL